MTTITVWFYVATAVGNISWPVALGPYADLESCMRVRAAHKTSFADNSFDRRLHCVQVNIPAERLVTKP